LFQRFIDPDDIEPDNGDSHSLSVHARGIIEQWIGVIGLQLCWFAVPARGWLPATGDDTSGRS